MRTEIYSLRTCSRRERDGQWMGMTKGGERSWMYGRGLTLLLLLFAFLPAAAQLDMNRVDQNGFNQIDQNGNLSTRNSRTSADSLGTDKEVPHGIYEWTVDAFGDRTPAKLDTVPHMFMNSIFTSGLRSEYNTTGNNGTPRINRIYADRPTRQDFFFIEPYDFFVKDPTQFHFTNTLSPFTNLSYNSCGNRVNGEDHFIAKFGVNAGKRLGVGFNVDYLYARGYYTSQSTSHFNYTMYGSYLGDHYQAHILFSTNHQKVAENGGITDDNYITHPEIFSESYALEEIPVMMSKNWNRNDNQHIFLTHRYNVGFHRKVKMTEEEIKARKFAMEAKKDAAKRAEKENGDDDTTNGRRTNRNTTSAEPGFAGRPDNAKIATGKREETADSTSQRITVAGKAAADSLLAAGEKAKEDTMWMKDEYVPVTSFIHTMTLDNYRRIYQAYETPENYYADTFDVEERLANDSIYDKTQFLDLKNTLAISMLEGFNKWAKAGLKVFAQHELRHYSVPNTTGRYSWNKNTIDVGGQISKTQGKLLHYAVTGSVGVVGDDAGRIRIDATADLNFPLFGDTVTLKADGFYHHDAPSALWSTYRSRHFWWDNDLSMTDHLRAQGSLSYQKTRTTLRFAFDELRNYAYLATTYDVTEAGRVNNAAYVVQSGSPITVLTAQLAQDLTFGPLNWESVVTWQKSTDNDALPLPALNIYTNLYLRFKIAKVLKCDFGADARYYTKYDAPAYVPGLGAYAVQGNATKEQTGGYPLVNVYANFHLKHTRFFVMMSHINAGSGSKEYFFTPHYALNGRVFRFGLSWNFWN